MTVQKHILSCILIFLALLAPSAVQAVSFEDGRVFEAIQDNDWFGGDDRWNTNDVRIAYISAPIEQDAAARISDDISWLSLPLWESSEFFRRWTFAGSQSMFTPASTSNPDLIEDDRPYAGWLNIALGLNKQSRRQLDALELTMGVVGPWALGEEAQNFIHTEDQESKGWDNQLRNEPGFMLAWQRYLRVTDWSGPGWGFDAIPHFGGVAGNVYTFANAGLELRAGQNLPSDFGSSLAWQVGHSGTTAPTTPDDPRLNGRYGWHVFAVADGRYMAHNIFLDGNTWRDSHSVDKEEWVADLSVGAALLIRRVKVTYTHTMRTKEFTQQPEVQWFGSVNLSVVF
ncbi:lipid A deacylase LpxR family protein [Desulfocurvibacter africanus]|uniref:Lipid A deacylase LpxR family protein n=1 Tax=Desulfocurvibacter africanus subsp. africanus str. Walvis Bay TaxID=690850 RepID=F3YYZ9_DESAF|nr:lipid A deacylase LpxR family protein [Desulfocurvibacter africanus]EGJ49644.1 Protein of unknown function DUF2219 [Desulfocurvibacter africanus subsp. africanus str. Walvis Bay]